jgi:hypothetical protein
MDAAVNPKLAARRRRTGAIRQWVAIVAVTLFVAFAALIAGQMASGRDPVLGAAVVHESRATTSAPVASTAAPASVTTSQS